MSARAATVSVPVSLVEGVCEAFFFVDRDLRVTVLNPAAQHLVPAEPAFARDDGPDSSVWKGLFQQFGRAIREGTDLHTTFTNQAGHCFAVDACPHGEALAVRIAETCPSKISAEALGVTPHDVDRVLHGPDLAMLAADSVTNKIIAVDRAFSTLIGYSAAELVGRDLSSITHPEDAVLTLESVLAAEHGGQPCAIEKRYIHRSGEVIWVDITVSRVTDPRSGRTRLLGVCRNISERKRAEHDLRRSEWRLRSLIDNLESMVTIVDHDCKITYHNPAVERILGHARADRIGRDAFELLHPDDLALACAQWNASLRMYGSVAHFEARFRHKDGSWCWFDVVGKNMLHNPAVSGFVLVSTEASERLETRRRLKEYTTELEQSTLQALADAVSSTSRGARELLVAVAGELRTPVSGIVGFAELLLQTTLNSPQRECAERIRDSGMQLLKVFDQSVGEPAV